MRVLRTAESFLERRVCKRAGVINVKLNVQGQTGWPDRLFLIPGGRPLFVEFKRPGEKPTPKQLYNHEMLRRLGYAVEVHDTEEGALRAITRAVEAARVPAESDQVPP